MANRRKLHSKLHLIDEQMLALLEWAAKYPTRWHDIGKIEASIKAAELHTKRRVIENLAGNESVQANLPG